MTDLIIKEYEPGLRAAWDTFVHAHPDGTAYHSQAWQEVVNATFNYPAWHLLACSPDGNICGILSLVRIRSRLFGDFMLSLPYVNYCGVLASSPAADQLLMQRACEIGAATGVAHIEFRDRKAREPSWPVRTDKVEMVLELATNAEAQWSELKAKLRSQIRRPQRENISVRTGKQELVPEFYRVFARNMRDLGTPVYSQKFFTEMTERLGDQADIVTVFLDAEPVAAGLLIHHGETTEIPSASSLRKYNHLSVNMLLYWECIKLAIERGSKQFDFGRCTIDSGTHRFKKQWGAQAQQLHWHYWLREDAQMPALNPDNSNFALAIRAWQKLPVWAANLLGPRIVRNLP